MKFTYPDGADDFSGILGCADAITDAASSYRSEIEYNGVGNVLYYLGYQWRTFMPEWGRWRPLAYEYKPVVNRFAPLVNTVASMLVRFNVPITYTPATEEPADVAAAFVADRAHAVIERETEVRRWTPEAARWLVLTGNVFLINGYERSERNGLRPVRAQQCVGSALNAGCGATFSDQEAMQAGGRCPQCGAAGLAPTTLQVPKGRHTTEVRSPLHCYFDNRASRIEHSPYFMVEDRVPKSWVIDAYGEEAISKISDAGDSDNVLADSLAYAVGTTGLSTPDDQDPDETYKVRRLWLDPHRTKAPGGIYAVIVGNTVMEALDYPFKNEYGQPMRGIVHIPFDQVPGRLLAKSRCDDLRGLQDQLNKIEAYLDLHTRRMAGGKLLLPRGMGIGRVVGETGQVLTYDAMPNIPAPQFVPGMSVPQYFFNWKQDILAAMDAVMGTFEVSRGEAPKGVSAYAAIQFLEERGTEAQSNLQDNWAIGKLEWARQQLNIFREYADEPRILALGVGSWSARKFSKADLAGGVDLDVDIGQSRPRTQVGKRAVVDQIVRLGGVNMANPYEKFPVLKALGADDLMPDLKVHEERAARENDAFTGPPNPTLPPPPLGVSPALAGYPLPFPWDNHMVHVVTHQALLFSEKGEALPPPARAALVEHMMIHQREIQAMQAMQPLGPGQVAPGPGNESGANRGTAKGGSTEQGQLDRETQDASPDTFTGAAQ